MEDSTKIKCNVVSYRKGFIEVIPEIHPGCINIETWEIQSEINLEGIDFGDGQLPDSAFSANTEIEMGLPEAKQLVALLISAIEKIEAGDAQQFYQYECAKSLQL